MRRFFQVAAFGLLSLNSSFALADEQDKNIFAALPHGYTQEELEAFGEENRFPVTPRYRGILETRFKTVEPYLVEASFCTKEGASYQATFSFAATAPDIDSAYIDNQPTFYRNLDRRAGEFDSYLRDNFTSENGQTPESLRGFLDGAQESLSGEGFNPMISGSVRQLAGGCLIS